jgi:hypothetical protein
MKMDVIQIGFEVRMRAKEAHRFGINFGKPCCSCCIRELVGLFLQFPVPSGLLAACKQATVPVIRQLFLPDR